MNKTKSINLLIALMDGYILIKDYHYVLPESYEKGDCLLYLYNNDEDLATNGWDSYYCKPKDCLMDIVLHPNWFEVSTERFDKGDKPWKQNKTY